MKEIIAFSKNLAFSVGGAEKSLYSELLKSEGNKTICYIEGKRKDKRIRINYPDEFKLTGITPRFLLNRFFFSEYVLNRKCVIDYFKKSNGQYDELWTQNLWAPAAIRSFEGKVRYYVRDELFLNQRVNYHCGIRKVLKYFYDLADNPAFSIYCKDQIFAIERADEIISNSKYMHDQIKEKFGVESSIVLPFIDRDKLLNGFSELSSQIYQKDKGIVLLGDSYLKGTQTFYKLAKHFPNHKFYLFSRTAQKTIVDNNVIIKPWVSNPQEAYKYAKVTLMPSVWAEAYGRVAAESLALGIPCIVSNVGGLPEAVCYQDDLIANNYEEFVVKLQLLL
ncbi:glycosyltransferase [Vibrio tritonius]|uniref:Glycosyltransferase n=1 Tax=Vibrio tritonius TaxID=1435069 RepID=A0ABS7YN74_9VIBR|nr:glycosyltransferase [Vibrio tritonius]MCA2015710.1 glycosyltransferase [Vibrio tritonius]